MSKKSNKVIPFRIEVDNVCTEILEQNTVSKNDRTMITGIQNFCARTGVITSRQMSQVGRCSKVYLQDGKFDNHGWWDGSKS